MHKAHWNLRTLVVGAILASSILIVSVWAQTLDENSELVAEEMTIDEALSTDLSPAEDVSAEMMMEAEKGVDIGTLDVAEPDLSETTDAAEMPMDEGLSGLDVTDEPTVDAGLPAMDLDLSAETVDSESAAGMDEPIMEEATLPTGDTFDPMSLGDSAPEPVAAEVAEPVMEEVVAEPVMESASELVAEPASELFEAPASEGVMSVESMPEAAVVVEPQPEAVFVEPVVASAAPMSDRDKAVQLLRESEQLRRRAFAEHASEKLAAADIAFKAGQYVDSQRYYEQAVNALEQAGGRPENQAVLERARAGAMESLYRRALQLRKDGDLDTALKLARESSLQGHARAATLAQKIEKDMAKPPAPPKKDEPRWKQEEYLKKQSEIQNKLRMGREHFMANELDKAQEQFEAVLAGDPHNTEAIRWREKVTQTRFDRASAELETTRQDMMSRVRETWNPRDYGAGQNPQPTDQPPPSPVDGQSPQERVLAKMASIIIPEVDFRQANIHDVIQFLQDNSVEFDPSPDSKKGVNIILNLGTMETAPAEAVGDTWGAAGADGAAVAPGGTELITFRAREISLLEALRIVTDVANLKFRVDGNVVMVLPFNAPESTIVHRMYDVLPTVIERIQSIRESAASTGGDRNDFISLGGGGSESAPTDVKAFFTEMGVQWPLGASIKYIPAIGKLMVANTADNLAVFEQRLAALNIVPKQIEIEARFVEVNQTDLNALGFEWLLTDNWEVAYKSGDENLPIAQRQRVQVNQTSFTKGNRYVTDLSADTQAPENLQNASDSILSIASVLTNPELSMVLHALEQKGSADLLSAPKVTTQSGVPATIKVVTEYIYPSDYTIEPGVAPTLNSDGSLQTAGTPPVVTPAEFETREVGVILEVTADVSTEGEMINLTMSPEVVTEPDWRNYGQTYTDASGEILQIPIEQPFFHSRSISTSILIYNGATVVMGGMITEERQTVDDKIPLLGDIPVIGRLFQSKYDNSIKKNLLIFVTARLVDPAGRAVGQARDSAVVQPLVNPQPATPPSGSL